MRCRHAAAKGHRQGTCHRTAKRTGRDNAQRITCRKGNCTLRNKGQAHDKVSQTGLTLFSCKLVTKQQRAQRNCNRRYHAANHNCCHNLAAYSTAVGRSQGSSTKNIGCLVQRAAEVNRHHAAQHKAHENLARRAHARQRSCQPLVEGCSRRIDNVGHQNAHNQKAQHRIQQNRLESLQTVRQHTQHLAQCQNQIAAEEACKQRSEEAAAAGCCQKAAHDAQHQRRTLANTHSDIACQNRHHHAERQTADVLEEGCQRRSAAKLRRSGKLHIKHKGQRNENAAADNEGQHMRNAIHQMLIDLSPQTFLSLCSFAFSFAAAFACISRNLAAQNLLNQFFRLVNAVSHLHENNRLACKTLYRNIFIRSYNNALGFFYLFSRQLIFYAAAAICFDLHSNAQLACHFL